MPLFNPPVGSGGGSNYWATPIGQSYLKPANQLNAVHVPGYLGLATPPSSVGRLTLPGTTSISDGIAFGSDVSLYRVQSNQLGVNQSLRVDNASGTGNAISVGGLGIVQVDFPAVAGGRFNLDNNGQLSLAQKGSTAGIVVGGDASLYRSTAGGLQLNNSLSIAAYLGLATPANAQAILNFPANVGPSGGILFGGDTSLYRTGVGALKTDGSFTATPIIGTTASSNNQPSAIFTGIVLATPGIRFSDGTIITTTTGLGGGPAGSITTATPWTYTAPNTWTKLSAGLTSVEIDSYLGLATPANAATRLSLPANTGTAGGILFGSDTNIYRNNVGAFRVDNSLGIATPVTGSGTLGVGSNLDVQGISTQRNTTFESAPAGQPAVSVTGIMLATPGIRYSDGTVGITAINKYTTPISVRPSTPVTITHNLNTRTAAVEVMGLDIFTLVSPTIQMQSVNTVTLTFLTATPTTAYQVTVIG